MRIHSTLPSIVGALLVAVCLATVSPPAAADEPPSGGRVPTVTRLVKLFLDKEELLGAAVRSADATALADLLTDDFELRIGARPASPIPRADWMRESLRTRDAGGDITGMAVHDFGTVAIASFTESATTGSVFVVDVWRRDGADWKLAVRYASPAGAPTFSIPDSGATGPEIPKKY